MELKDWELQELEKIRAQREQNLLDVYFKTTDPEEKKEILGRMKQSGEDEELVKICEELYEHRYVSREKQAQKIDYAIRGWVNIKFLPEAARGWFSKKKFDKRANEILDDLGYHICSKYGEVGKGIWYKELCNIVRVYMKLCREDKGYGSILFGFGSMKPSKLMVKIAQDLVTITYSIPKEIGMLDIFEPLATAARQVFLEVYPKESMLYEGLLDESDMKVKPLKTSN